MRALLILLLSFTALRTTSGQNTLFGSLDDPMEQSNLAWWQTEQTAAMYGGLSLIGPQWRSEGRITYDSRTSRFATRLTGTLRAGIYGAYEPDIDEAYDLLRLIEFVRFRNARSTVYVRVGPLDRTRLGTGHVVNFLNSQTIWNERTIGMEASGSGRVFGVAGFVDNLGLDGLIGGRISVSPFWNLRNRRLRSITLAVNGIQDRSDSLPSTDRFSAYHFEMQMEAVYSGAFSLHPFVSYARARPSGQGLYFGADFRSDNFIDLARIHFRLAMHYNSRRFLPGYVGAFWQVQNPHARVLISEGRIGEEPVDLPAGIDLMEVRRSHALVTELRILVFERFELWYQFLRSYSDQAIGEYHLRLSMRTRRLRLSFGQDRGELRNFFSLFNDLGDLSTLHFEAAYRISGIIWTLVDARYTFEREESPDDSRRYTVHRRFAPLVGIRLAF